MAATVKTTVSLPKALFEQVDVLAQQLNVSRSRLLGLALEQFINRIRDEAFQEAFNLADIQEPVGLPDQTAVSAQQTGGERTGINQGDIYWVPVEAPGSAEPGYIHPHVVIQDNVINRSRVSTVVVCALTSNVKRAKAPGNVLLEAGEANLPRQSVVEVSKVSTVAKGQMGAYIGSLSMQRVQQILAGMQFLQAMMEHRGL